MQEVRTQGAALSLWGGGGAAEGARTLRGGMIVVIREAIMSDVSQKNELRARRSVFYRAVEGRPTPIGVAGARGLMTVAQGKTR